MYLVGGVWVEVKGEEVGYADTDSSTREIVDTDSSVKRMGVLCIRSSDTRWIEDYYGRYAEMQRGGRGGRSQPPS